MKACMTGSFALLFLSAGGVHAQQAPPLQLGTPVRATLAAGDTLRYELNLAKDRFIAGRVDQDSVDATVTITGPSGSRVFRGARVGRGGPEAFAFATDTAGRYVIAIAPATAGKSGAVRVQLTRSEPVATTPEGKVDQAAAQLYKDTPGAVVGVIQGGKLTFVKGYGAADLTNGPALHRRDADQHRFFGEAVHRIRTHPAGLAGQALPGRRRAEAHPRAQGLRPEDHAA